MGRRAILAVIGTALLWWPATAGAQDPVGEEAALGPVEASFTYERVDEWRYKRQRLQVRRGGQLALDVAVAPFDCAEYPCIPVSEVGGRSLRVADLEGDGEPEVLVDLYTGGAHCCFVTELWRWDGERYRHGERNWGDPGYKLTDLGSDGRLEFRSGDHRFAYRFSSFAGSRFPLRVLRFDRGSFRDVTNTFPAEIRADRARQWRSYLQARRKGWETRGILAAWAADRYRLGERRATLRSLRSMRRRGALGTGQGLSARRFIDELDGFLRRLGYQAD